MGMLLAIFPSVIQGAPKYPRLNSMRLTSIKAPRNQIDHINVVIQETLTAATDERSSTFERIKKRLDRRSICLSQVQSRIETNQVVPADCTFAGIADSPNCNSTICA